MKMPFYNRAVEPTRLRKLNVENGEVVALGAGDDSLTFVDTFQKTALDSLEKTCCHTLANVLRQLSDLSRNASNIFLEIETEADLVTERSSRIRLRIETLQRTVRRRIRVKIRE